MSDEFASVSLRVRRPATGRSTHHSSLVTFLELGEEALVDVIEAAVAENDDDIAIGDQGF